VVGRDLHEGERVRRLLDLRVGVVNAPSLACEALRVHGRPDALLLEDRVWPESEAHALAELRELSSARKLALILSRRHGERYEHAHGVPVVDRPYRLDELSSVVHRVMLRSRAG
jgi:hypothetical protein